MRLLPAFLTIVLCSHAAVQRVYVLERSDVQGGKVFANAGAYEEIKAEVRFAVDPKLPANRIITDIDLAPRNPRGLVEFSVDVVLMRPRDPSRGNGTALVEIPNRGNVGSMIRLFDRGSRTEPLGDELLFRNGYTLVWVGWQWDVPRTEGLVRLRAPVARAVDGKPIRGPVRSQFVPEEGTTEMPLGDRNHIAYSPVHPDDSKLQLTVRDAPAGEREVLPRSSWRFTPSLQKIEMRSGFQAGRIYEIVYEAEDPVIAGLGLAAVRDFVSFLKYGADVETLFSDQRRWIKRSIGFGQSQSGRFLRQFVYDGFNADERSRKVFDGVWPHVAGAGRGDVNLRFAQASRDGHPRMNLYYPVDLFPFTDQPEKDPITGRTGALLGRAMREKVAPKFVQTDGSYEYWGRAASLIHTTPDGTADAAIPEDSRIYFLAGTQHGAASPSRRTVTRYDTNPADYRWALRALLAAMNAWLRDGAAPPASVYPRLESASLVAPSKLKWPDAAGPKPPAAYYVPRRLDFGPDFLTAGIMSIEPPKLGAPWPILVPQVDADGNEMAGIRLPHVAVPLATYTGWNPRAPATGAPDTASDMQGSFLPFALTQAERSKSGDVRLSVAERYASKQIYLQRVDAAISMLVRDGFVLSEDVSGLRADAEARWNQALERQQP